MRLKIKKNLMVFATLFGLSSVAQEIKVNGIVFDEFNNPLPGASIVVKESAKGVVSDFDGIYSITANVGDILTYSYVGYSIKEITISANIEKYNIILTPDNALDEIVVTALGIKREKKSLGFSQQTVAGNTLGIAKDTDISDALAGKVSGVQLVGSPSSTFESSNIRLRGEVGVLYVVDGIKISSPSDINMEDVENISVLKGIAGTALYGSEAKNGAVIITTKSAKDGDSKITLDIASSLSSLYLLPSYQNEYGGGYVQEFSSLNGQLIPNYSADESWGPRMDGTLVRHWDSWIEGDEEYGKLRAWSPQPNNIKDFYNTGAASNITLGFLNGGDKHSIKTTINNIKTTLITPNSEREQTTISFKGSYKLSEKLTFNGAFNYQYRYTFNNPQTSGYAGNFNEWWQRQLDMDRLKDYKRDGQIVSWNIRATDNPKPLYWDSPYFKVNENLNHETKNALYGSVGLEYKFNEKLNILVDLRRTFDLYNYDDRTAWGGLATVRFLEQTEQNSFSEAYAQINYNEKFGDFDFVVNAGGQWNQRKYKWIRAESVGGLQIPNYYSINTSIDTPDYDRNTEHVKITSGFATTSIGYKNLAYIDGSFRKDWGSTAASSDNSLDTYGLSGSLIFSEFIKNNSLLSFGKLRAGFAQAPSFPDVYELQNSYSIGNAYGSNVALTIPDKLSNPLLKGGVREEIEAGIELKFLQNRLGFDFTYFTRNDKELPTDLTLTGTTGYTSTVGNGSELETKGWEIGFTAIPFQNEDFRWSMNFNIADYEKKVLKINDLVTSNQVESGRTANLVHDAGDLFGNIYGYDIVKNENGIPLINSNGTRVYTSNYVKVANIQADFTGGFFNSFNYKNFDLSFGIDFQGGGKFYSTTKQLTSYSGTGIETVGNNELGNPIRDNVIDNQGNIATAISSELAGANSGGVLVEGVDEATGQPVSYYTNAYTYFKSMNRKAGEWIYDSSYIKLRQLKIGYRFPENLISQLPLEQITISLYANNLWLIYSAVDGIDPSEIESYNSSDDDLRWTEGAQDPNQRTIGLNLKLTF